MEAFSVAVLLLLALSGVYAQTIDEVLQRASRGTLALRATNGAILVDNGNARLNELDIAELLPCRSSTGQVPVSAAERAGSEPVEGSWSDATVQSTGSNPSCSASNGRRQKRNVIDPRLDWPLVTTIPYEMDRSLFTSAELANIDAAFAEYAQYTCITFVERTNEDKFLQIVRDGGCWSYVGFYSVLDPQRLSLSSGCANSKSTPIHELYHALGSWHQQSRPDRDTYVTINYANILAGREHNFDIKTNSEQYSSDYSYRSVMHYGRTFFTSNGFDTITTVDPAFQNIIGNAPTFSFEDLQVLHRHYQCDNVSSCPLPNPCAPSQYRGSDCECYCKNDHIDNNVPAVICEADSCDAVGVPCSCTAEKCASLQNTECDVTTGACECEEGYIEENGNCVMDTSCDTVGVPCQCTSDVDCDLLPNTECNTDTNACECKEDFYESAPNQCTSTPRCRRIGIPCVCSAQGGDACRRIRGSYCDEDTDSCTCFPFHSPPTQKHCIPDCDPVYITDGAMVSPFSNENTPMFNPIMSDEPLPADMFGIGPNGYVLAASGVGESDVAILTVPRLTRDRTLRNIDLCIDLNLKMTNALVGIDYRFKGSQEWRTIEYSMLGSGGWGVPVSEVISIKKPRNFRLRIRATGHLDAAGAGWMVKIDPLLVRNCDCTSAP